METFFALAEDFIGDTVLKIQTLSIRYDTAPCLIGVVFVFSRGALLVTANPNDDTVVVHKAVNPMDARSIIGRGDVREVGNSSILRGCEGKVLTNLWRCESAPGYYDSIDFAFGSLVFPTVKIFCVTSELFAVAISSPEEEEKKKKRKKRCQEPNNGNSPINGS